MSNRTEVAKRKPSQAPPGDYRHCASSRLYVRREKHWFTAGESPARELVRSTR
jgi:hypothetical protein